VVVANLRDKRISATVASLVVLLGIGVLVQRVGAAAYAGGDPCPASWFPLQKEPLAIQFAWSRIRQQPQRSVMATAQARPRVYLPPPTPDPRYTSRPSVFQGYIPPDLEGITALPNDALQSYNQALQPITSIWQLGVVVSPNHRGYGAVIVYAAGPLSPRQYPGVNPNPAFIRQVFPQGDLTSSPLPASSNWQCPRNLGALAIGGVTGMNGVISFTSDAGVSGTLNMATGAWTFSQ
jgi:hypothetical protein